MKLSASISPIWRRYGLSEIEIYAAIQRCGFNYVGYDFCADNAAFWMNRDAGVWGRDMKSQLTEVGAVPVVAHVCGVNPFDGPESIEYVKQAVLCAGALGAANVVIKCGELGCYYSGGSERGWAPAIPVEVVDTTGAGDTFNGTLAAMLAEGRSIAIAAKIANRVSSLGVTRKYAVSSIPSVKEIEKIVEETEK